MVTSTASTEFLFDTMRWMALRSLIKRNELGSENIEMNVCLSVDENLHEVSQNANI